MMPSVMASPADGPPISAVCTATLTGKFQSYWFSGSMPRYAVGTVARRPAPGFGQPLGRLAQHHLLVHVGPGHERAGIVDARLLHREVGRGARLSARAAR